MWLLPSVWIPVMSLTRLFLQKKAISKNTLNSSQSFTNALQKGMTYVNNHSAAEIAKVIAPQFKDTDEATIAMIVERYQKQDTWKDDLVFTKDSYELLLDILEEAGVLTDRPPYKDLITTTYAKEAR